jgi:hypothetical protein
VRRLPFALLLALGAGSLLFDLTLPLRLPSDADWAEAAGALRAKARAGDAVQIWPAWAERARLFVDAAPVLAEEDLAQADYAGVQRLWILSLPRAPYARSPFEALRQRGATAESEPRRFGALALQPWDLHAPPIAADLTRAGEWHEVDYVARRCARVPIGARIPAHGAAGAMLHVRGGIIGERAYDAGRPGIAVQIFSGGAPLGTLAVTGAGWHRLDIAVPTGPEKRDFLFAVSSADTGRPFCLQAWTTR